MVESGSDQPLVLWLFGSAIIIIGGGFTFVTRRISQVRDEAREDVNAMRTEFEQRQADGRQDRLQIWAEIRANQREAAELHRELISKLSETVTRNELREDLRGTEARIAQLLKNNDHQQHH